MGSNSIHFFIDLLKFIIKLSLELCKIDKTLLDAVVITGERKLSLVPDEKRP